jgi:tetratricopeptide (TPR) repeat protein
VALAWALAAQAGAQEPAFVDTPAGQAFKAQQYPAALTELERMLAADPQDVLALRYLGITLDRLGRYQEALDAFGRALGLEPESAATHFHMGVTYYKARAPEAARASFVRAAQLAPGSVYDQVGGQYLDALAQQQVELQRAGAPKLFSLFVDVGAQYDSNIPAAPDDPALYEGKHGGARVVEYLSAELRLLRRPGWLGLVEGSTYQAQYPDDAFDGFRLSTYSLGALLQRDTTLVTLPLVLSARYGYTWVFQGGDQYSGSHAVTASVQLDEARWIATNVYYRYTRDDFEDEGFDAAISSRDADNHAVGVAQILYFADRRGQVRIGYEYQKNLASGLNFDLDGHRVTLSASAPLPWAIQLDGAAEYAHEWYPSFQGPVQRKTDRWGFRASLARWFYQGFLVRLTGAWTTEQSSYDVLEYDRWVVGMSLSYAY